ncbi:ABC transporter substrate-binding protein [Deinococcus peraridilitoris]|uniref:ABC-type sugar transport system, periplasmic component n=1 Tax=Deinococcus peraridilitoris (strain DSM 19664 / LMG 22246 / CIP 109416 / KR-200) TaxID=937777 RepID=K9ZY46_DEIPD|nr:ABC transporter substrate-binding protein [Deinococcus peraridilitoris]AFZ65660.1 ABC-type sugar transport system, periplasmic component [Deinococcus peraridilitoris DSM 19664]
MKRKVLIVTGMLLGLNALSAPAAAQQKVNLKFSAHWLSEQRRPTINSIVETWNKRNPNIQVEYIGVPFDQIITKTVAGVAAGNAPDVVVIDIRTAKQRAAKNQNVNMSALGADQLKSGFFPNLWETGTYNGKQYALPFVTDTRLLFYSKAAFKEVGLDPNKPPKTWAELWSYAEKLDKKDGNRFSRMGFHPMFGDFGYEGWVTNTGGSLWDKNYENPRVNSPDAVKALDWIKKWTDKYGANNVASFRASFGGGAQDEFMSGKVPMVVKNGNYLTTLKRNAPDLQYGFVPVPTEDGKQHESTSWGGGFNIEIPAGTKHPKEAFAFAKYLATEGAKVWAAEQNDLPGYQVARLANKNPEFLKQANNLKHTFISVSPVFAPNYDRAVAKAVDDVLLRGQAVKPALDEAQAAVEKLVADGKRDATR